MLTFYLNYISSILGSSVSKSAMSGSNLFYNITNVINTTISTLTSEDIQSDFHNNQENENKESTIDDKSIMFITGGIFLGLFIASLGILIKSRKKEKLNNNDLTINEEPEIDYDLDTIDF